MADSDYPFGIPAEQAEDYFNQVGESWGGSQLTAEWVPSRAGEPPFLEWLAKVERSVHTPAAAEAYARAFTKTDARAILPAIRVPTLVLHVTGSPMIPVEHGRYIADHIEDARFVELPGSDAFPYWEYPELFTSAIEEFLTGAHPAPIPHRRLATVLFSDIVESTRRAEELGDRSWRTLLHLHDETAKRITELHAGVLVKDTGDGVMAIFDGPGGAIRAATDLRDELSKVQLELRIGIHAGEVDTTDDDVSGVAVHIAARVMTEADPGEILVSRTIRDLIIGSDIALAERGAHRLKGLEGEWDLYSVLSQSPTAQVGPT